MTAFALIQKMVTDGVRLSLTPTGKIKAAGEQAAVSRWVPILKEKKTEIITALWDADFKDAYEERAAIMEFDGGLSRQAAEAAAYEDCKVIWLNRREGT